MSTLIHKHSRLYNHLWHLMPSKILLWSFTGGLVFAVLVLFSARERPSRTLAASTEPFVLGWSSYETDFTQSVAWGDYDGDGDLDLVVGNLGQKIRLYRNDNNILSTNAVWESNEEGDTRSVAWGDYDGDGDLDLATGNGSRGNKQLNRLYRNDNGVLTGYTVWSPVVSDATQSVAWGDYDGDGDLDLAAGNLNDPNRIYRNDNGVLVTQTVWSPLGRFATRSVVWGDYDGDGDLDLAVGNTDDPNLLYRNDNGFLGDAPVWSSNEISATRSVAWGDYDGDGDLDLAVGNSNASNLLYRNDNGLLTHFAVWSSEERDDTRSIAWGDYDSDGDLDLLAGNFNQPNRLYSNNDGTLTPQAIWFSAESDFTQSVAWGDYDGDGDLDIATGTFGQPNRLYRNAISTLLTGAVWEASVSDRTQTVAWGDYDGDGDLDLAAGNLDDRIRLYQNNNGLVLTHASWASSQSYNTRSVAWGDYDGDGDLDLAVGNSSQPNLVYRNDSGLLVEPPIWSSYEMSSTHSIAWGDYDNDGDLDLAVGNSNAPNFIYRNDDGIITTNAVWSSTEADDTHSIAWGDYDSDGDLDLAVGNLGQPNCLYRNENGSLTRTAVWVSNERGSTQSVAWGDYDNDGDLDLAVGNLNQPNLLYRNDAGKLTTSAVWSSTESDATQSVAWVDYDGDGDLDLAVGNGNYINGQENRLYRNDTGVLTASAVWSSTELDITESLAWGDYDGDGDLDLATGNGSFDLPGKDHLYRNNRDAQALPNSVPVISPYRPGANADGYSVSQIISGIVPITYTVFDAQGDPIQAIRAYYSLNGIGKWFPAVAATDTITQYLSTANYFTQSFSANPLLAIPPLGLATSPLTPTAPQSNAVYIADVDVYINISHSAANSLIVTLTDPTHQSVVLVNQQGGLGGDFVDTVFDDEAMTSILSGTAPFMGSYRPEQFLSRFENKLLSGEWNLSVRDATSAIGGTLNSWGLTFTLNSGQVYTYNWDVTASGFFGQSDNVVFRIVAVPGITVTRNNVAGPYMHAAYASQTYPFRVRGTQVQVISGTQPISNAIVYRLPAGEDVGGTLIRGATGAPFTTDGQGYLLGRGVLQSGDRLLALAPVLTSTQGYALFYTNGTPQVVGLDTFTVTNSGIQTLTVSAQHPLYLFDLDISLEWDAHNDSAYLDQLSFDLKRASHYLYDFTNGQMALGDVFVYQNTAAWSTSHIVIPAHNRLRPFAVIGGIVATDTVDAQHNTISDTIRYAPGQVTIGSTWNRYGRPGQMLGDDWSVILAHELGHYLLYHDDVYLGFDANGNLIPISTCTGSAMGDLYDRPANTEFIFDESQWQANCSQTLAEQLLGRHEWETMDLWYPELVTPTNILSGPSIMPFELTTITIFDPLTPTETLADPTFYLNYQNNVVSSADARVYLFQSDTGGEWLIHQGSPIGGQNRAVARGAEPDDRLCVFDVSQSQFGCETVEFGDDQVQLKSDPNWNPVIQVTPVNSQTLNVVVSNVPTASIPALYARVFPDLYYAPPTHILTLVDNTYYSATFVMTDTGVINGNVQVWVDEPASETNPRRESLVAYSVGGNPGGPPEGGGGTIRGNGGIGTIRGNGGIGTIRGNGGIGTVRGNGGIGTIRGNGGIGGTRSGHAPLLSPDGQLIYFTLGNTEFMTGTLFVIQSLASVPDLPPGRTLVGQGYALVASPGAELPVGSVSVQYLSNDVTAVGAQEEQVSVYVYTSTVTGWVELPTTRDTYFDVVVAASQGPGLYALLASVQIPLEAAGWNLVAYPLAETRPVTEVLESIDGYYNLVYGYNSGDPNDPWKLYSPHVPPFVNDLVQLEPGRGYWISATQPITWYLAPLPPTGLALHEPAALSLPPSTFYGTVVGGEDFSPVAGLPVEARINGVVCARGVTQVFGNEIAYVVDVEAKESVSGCGQPGAQIQFIVSGRVMAPLGLWTNDVPTHLPLIPAHQVYLPLVKR